MSAANFKRAMLMDFTFTPTTTQRSVWIDLEDIRFRCGIRKSPDTQTNVDQTSKEPSHTIFLWTHHPKRHGFFVYQVQYGVVGTQPRRMTRHEKLDPQVGFVYSAVDERNLEAKNIRIWLYLNDIIQEYTYRPIDQRYTRELWGSAQNKVFTDVELVVGGKTFNAHRAILAARSPVFSAMFQTDMVESRTGRVFIKDISPEVFRNFLEFLYTGILPTGVDQPDLLAAADMYQVETLSNLCKTATHDCDPEECVALIVESFI